MTAAIALGLLGAAAASVDGPAAIIGTTAFLVPLTMGLSALLLLQGLARGFGAIAASQAPGQLFRHTGLIVVIGGAALIGAQIGPREVLFAAIGSIGLSVVIAALWLRNNLRAALLESGTVASPDLMRRSLPFLGIALTGALLAEIATLMLGWWHGLEQAGLYQPVALRFAPRVAALYEAGDIATIAALSHKTALATTAFTIAASILLLLLGPAILGVFGQEFPVVAPALAWVAAASVFNAACGPVNVLLSMSGRIGANLRGQLVRLGATVALGALLIPGGGAIGAAQAVAGGVVACCLALLISVRRGLGFDPTVIGAMLRARRR